jgi:hypothetical protein
MHSTRFVAGEMARELAGGAGFGVHERVLARCQFDQEPLARSHRRQHPEAAVGPGARRRDDAEQFLVLERPC